MRLSHYHHLRASRAAQMAAAMFGFLLAVGRSAVPTAYAVPAKSDAGAGSAATAIVSADQIEADWLRQDMVRTLPVQRARAVTPAEDAADGCDGIKNGKWGFHTSEEENPWWQVDLGRQLPLDQVQIYNRADECAARAFRLMVLLSSDGRTWHNVYQHDGQPFYGAPDNKPLVSEGERAQRMNAVNAMGLYLMDAFGNLNLIYRDPEISSMYPTPVRPRKRPPVLGSRRLGQLGDDEGRMLLIDVYAGLESTPRGSITQLRLVGVPAKTQPTMNDPPIGITRDDPGKFVMGTVPVEADGSAYFRVPAGVPFFDQALDHEGMAVQTMRSVTYVQPGQTLSCIGCHEHRRTSPAPFSVGQLTGSQSPQAHAVGAPLAALREPSRLTPGPEGSWPLDFEALVQPVLNRHCIQCHSSDTSSLAADAVKPVGERPTRLSDLTAGNSHQALISFGGDQSLQNYVLTAYRRGRSTEGDAGARTSPVLKLLCRGHYDVKLTTNDWDRLITWMDTYAQRSGSFSSDQERRLRELRERVASLLAQPK